MLDLTKTAAPARDTEHKQLDEVTLLLAVKAFLLAEGPDLLASPATMYPASSVSFFEFVVDDGFSVHAGGW